MIIHCISVGAKPPTWAQEAFLDYQKRMPAHVQLQLKTLNTQSRGKNRSKAEAIQAETEAILQAIPSGCWVIALDRSGRNHNSEALAQQLTQWQHRGADVALLIGGPDGLSQQALERADASWSLSALTFPHALVRVILAEQLYRACCILSNHPYHR
jgi:23S rRNA (pseudouridine1915-N3)-methyltransferase